MKILSDERAISAVHFFMVIATTAAYIYSLRTQVQWSGSGSDLGYSIIGGLALLNEIASGEEFAVVTLRTLEGGVKPTYPLFYSIFQAALFLNLEIDLYFLTARVISILCYGLAMLFLCRVAMKRFGAGVSLAMLATVVTAPYFFEFKEQVRSEFMFMLVLYALFYAEFHFRENQCNALSRVVIVSILCILCVQFRTMGIVVIPSLLASDLLTSKRIKISTLSIIVITLAAYFIFKIITPASPENSYLSQFGTDFYTIIETIKNNLIHYHWSLREYFSVFNSGAYQDGIITNTIYVAFVLSFIIGFSLALFTHRSLIELFFLAYFGLLMLHQTTSAWARYLIPFMPFFFMYSYVGFKKTSRLIFNATSYKSEYGPQCQNLIVLIAFISVVVINLIVLGSGQIKFEEFDSGPNTSNFSSVLRFAKKELPVDARILSVEPSWTFLLTGRLAIQSPRSSFCENHGCLNALSYIIETGATHVLLKHTDRRKVGLYGIGLYDREDPRAFRDLIYRSPNHFFETARFGPWSIYRIDQLGDQ